MHLTCCIVLFFSAPVHVYYFEFLAVVDNRSFVVYVCLHAVAYLGFHFGGGSKFFWKSGGICMARSAMQRVAKPRVC